MEQSKIIAIKGAVPRAQATYLSIKRPIYFQNADSSEVSPNCHFHMVVYPVRGNFEFTFKTLVKIAIIIFIIYVCKS